MECTRVKCRSRNKMFARQARGSTDFYISTDIPAKKENANCREYKTCVAHEIASTRNPLTLRAKGFQSRSAKHAERGTGAGGGSGESAGSEAKVSESHNNEVAHLVVKQHRESPSESSIIRYDDFHLVLSFQLFSSGSQTGRSVSLRSLV